ncbi:hypothetical protein, partial [Helicobacter bizzozeronii]|uniref:hypothetical protein n=1 Tax=Helicobacter bizzozeronii TaxID=56877 RepID=UPI001315883C
MRYQTNAPFGDFAPLVDAFKKADGLGGSGVGVVYYNNPGMGYANLMGQQQYKAPLTPASALKNPASASKPFNSAFGQFNNPTTYQSA